MFQENSSAKSISPQLQCVDGEFLSVQQVAYRAKIDGPMVNTVAEIRFVNDLKKTIEADLIFALPPNASLIELTVDVGGRVLKGHFKPRERAIADYKRAQLAKLTAALTETEGEDLARLRVAPIDAGELITVTMHLFHTLLPTSEGFRLIVPLTYMPRYSEKPENEKEIESLAISRPRPTVMDARASIDVEIAHWNGQPSLRCTSHKTQQTVGANQSVIRVESTPLDKDFILEICDRSENHSTVWWCTENQTNDGLGGAVAVAVIPPKFAEEQPVARRTVTFLVDRSGSMGGAPIESAIRAVRGCLRALEPQDQFNILAFDDRLEAFSVSPVPFKQGALKKADQYLNTLNARGGTEASMALQEALTKWHEITADSYVLNEKSVQDGKYRMHLVVFMTDGDVSGAEHVLKEVQAHLKDTRLHVLGIGDSVNHSLLSQLAALGGGSYTPVATNEDLEQALLKLKNAMWGPLWTDLSVTLETGATSHKPELLEPNTRLDLFAGTPLLMAWRGNCAEGTVLRISGTDISGDIWDMNVTLREQEQCDSTNQAGRIWALIRNSRITYRFNKEDDQTLELLGTRFGLCNRMVSMVAVHQEIRENSVENSVPVVLPLPKNIADLEPTVFEGATIHNSIVSVPLPGASGSKSVVYGAISPGTSQPAAPAAMADVGGVDDFSDNIDGELSELFGGEPEPMVEADMDDAPIEFESDGVSCEMLGDIASAPKIDSIGTSATDSAVGDDLSRLLGNLTADDAGLRQLVLLQNADGSFGDTPDTTLYCVMAFVSLGHTSRDGQFRAELRRTMNWLKAKLNNSEDNIEANNAVFSAALRILTELTGPERLQNLKQVKQDIRDMVARVIEGVTVSACSNRIEQVFRFGELGDIRG